MTSKAPKYEPAPPTGKYSMTEARALRDNNRHTLKWLDRCANPQCPRLELPEPQRRILVRANTKTCSKYCTAIVREAEKAANREPPKPIEIEEELPDYDAAPSEQSDYDGEFGPPIPLNVVRNSADDDEAPKGFAVYEPGRGKTQTLVLDIMAVYNRLAEGQALPAGPRAVMYRLKSAHPDRYSKEDAERITKVIQKMRQAGTGVNAHGSSWGALPWSWVADASRIEALAGGWKDADEYEASVSAGFLKQLQTGQKNVCEFYTEASASVPLMTRTANGMGASVYSGSGSSGAGLAYRTAMRALKRAYHDQETFIAGVGDCDRAGFVSVLRPHFEHVAGFLYAPNGSNQMILSIPREFGEDFGPVTMPKLEEEAGRALVHMQHLVMTPEYALEHALVEGDEQRQRLIGYRDSGTDMWDRDADHLLRPNARGYYKKDDDPGRVEVELESLDPILLRTMMISWLEEHLDLAVLARARADAQVQSQRVKDDMARAVQRRNPGIGWPA